MAREQYEEVAFQVIETPDGGTRSGWFPTGTGIVDGNVAVDYVWGNFPMQPNDDRTDSGMSFGSGEGDAYWAPTYMSTSDTLRTADYSVHIGNDWGGFDLNVPADSHINASTGWDGYPAYTTVPNLVGSNYVRGESATLAGDAGMSIDTVTTVSVFNINGEGKVYATEQNRGVVVAQTPRAGDGNNGGAIDIVVLDPDTAAADVVVPTIVGVDSASAQTLVESFPGLSYSSTTTDVGATALNDGLVKSQSPAAGTIMNGSGTVNAVVYAYVAP